MGNGDYARWVQNLLCFLLPLLCLGGEEPRRVLEYELKAAFLYNIAKFVEWPQNTFASSKDPIRICVLGKNPFGGQLDAVVEGKEIGGHPLTSEDVTDAHQARRCHILFVSSSERLHHNAVLDQVRSASVLTVGETPGFAEQARRNLNAKENVSHRGQYNRRGKCEAPNQLETIESGATL